MNILPITIEEPEKITEASPIGTCLKHALTPRLRITENEKSYTDQYGIETGEMQ